MRRDIGPRRSRSIESYLRRSRILAGVAILALVGAVILDVIEGDFWARHALLSGLVSSVIIVMLTVAVLNEVLERRRRQRWSVLAQYVMLELVRHARLIWTGVLETVGLLSSEAARPDLVEVNSGLVRDTPRLTSAVREVIADDVRRRRLHEEIAFIAVHMDELLGRWAGLMLNADVYAEVMDRHVELASDISWLNGLLDNSDPPDDPHRQRRARSSPAVQVEGAISGDALADRVVVITQLAEQLDRSTLQLAMQIVPVEWWEGRLGTTIDPGLRPAGVTET
jgi:hypothetical protein